MQQGIVALAPLQHELPQSSSHCLWQFITILRLDPGSGKQSNNLLPNRLCDSEGNTLKAGIIILNVFQSYN
jgi:hypothetical protein